MIEVKPIVYTGQDYVLMGMIHAFRLIINSQEKEVNFEKIIESLRQDLSPQVRRWFEAEYSNIFKDSGEETLEDLK
tara:strand:- start:308 stop:535 length:228 start_codon:yes stop_codon:yes gene_type:complete